MSAKIIGNVVIMRGLPGIGKSNLCKDLSKAFTGTQCQILTADDFFLEADGKIYSFDKEKLEDAYKWNFQRFKDAIKNNIPLIFIDNTNIKLYHYWQYIDYAQRHNYRASVLTIPHNDASDRELASRTPHGVEQGTIYKMRKEFEWPIERK